MATTEAPAAEDIRTEERETIVIRFCGDSGDGMQLAGTQMTNVSAVFGNDVSTLPDFPAEIRAPAGSLAGVSGYQLHFSSNEIFTPGDELDTLVAMNPAALKTNIEDLKRGGTLIVNENAFGKSDLKKAGYESNPLDDEDLLAPYDVHKIEMTRLTRDAVEGLGLRTSEAERCKNFFALGLVYWLYDRNDAPTRAWVKEKFAKKPAIAEANIKALQGGSNYGSSTGSFRVHYRVPPAKLAPGNYRKISGNEALAFGLVTAANLAGKPLFYAGYPITPASDILHQLARLKRFDVRTFQAEDEIAAMSAAIGAAFAGELAISASSGPGICLKGEAMGLGVMTELPMVIINVQRGGPSTGLPTKTEQSDLLLAMFGRNGESPMPIVAAATPADCFWVAQEALRIAVEFMTPVMLLSDGYIANGAEPWKIPEIAELTPIVVNHPLEPNTPDGFQPYLRNEQLVRPWVRPGTPGLMHRLGGLEKADVTGDVSYDPKNHEHMCRTRAQKVANVAETIPEQEVFGAESGNVLAVSWGGTFGAVRQAAISLVNDGHSVGHAHLRYLNPFPKNLGDLLGRFDKVIVPELNLGQLSFLLRGKYLVDVIGYNKVQGKPFRVSEVIEAIKDLLD